MENRSSCSKCGAPLVYVGHEYERCASECITLKSVTLEEPTFYGVPIEDVMSDLTFVEATSDTYRYESKQPMPKWQEVAEKFVTPCELPTPYERELLTILIEEASEIQQRATKALRFGLDEVQPGQSLNNAQRLDYEIGDFLAVLRRLQAIDISNTFAIEEAAKAKELKLKKYMQTELGEEK